MTGFSKNNTNFTNKSVKIITSLLNFFIVGIIVFSVIYYPAEQPAYVPAVGIKWYLLGGFVTIIITAFLNYLEKKTHYYEKLLLSIKNNRTSLLYIVAQLVITGVFSVLAELFLSHFVFGVSTTGNFFNRYRYYFVWSCSFVFVYMLNIIYKRNVKTENMFAIIAIASGLVMIFSSPAGHTCWDVDSHYKYAIGLSSVRANKTAAFDSIIESHEEFNPNKTTAKESEELKKILNENDRIETGTVLRVYSIPHIPAAICFSLGKLFGLSFVAKDCLARLINLLCYTLIVYSALKKLKSSKIIFMIIALFPTNIFLATNISYDWWVTSFMMLGTAYYLSEFQQPEKRISTFDNWVMCGSLAIACIPKQIYFPLMILPFFMKKNIFRIRKSEKTKYYSICIIATALLILSFMLRGFSSVNSGGDTRGGEDVNSFAQFNFILSSPLKYVGILLRFLVQYLSIPTTRSYICEFAYLHGSSGYLFVVSMLIIAIFTDKNEFDKKTSKWWLRAITIIVLFGTVSMIATSLYISFTAVGSDEILGCQPRYIIPLLPSILPIIGSCKITKFSNNYIYKSFFGIGTSVILFIGIYQAMILNML